MKLFDKLDHRHQIVAIAALVFFGIAKANSEQNEKFSKPDPKTKIKDLSSNSICSVMREIYIPSSEPGVAPVVGVQYLGKGLKRREIVGQQGESDLAKKMRVHFSDNNGRTWSPFAPLETGPDSLRQGEVFREDLFFAANFDSVSQRSIEMVLQRVFLGEPSDVLHKYWKGEKKFFDHMFYRLSADDGKTWANEKQLVVESGGGFDPKNWAKPDYLHANEMYGGYDVTLLRNGQIAYPTTINVLHPDDEEDAKIRASLPKYVSSGGYVGGVTCFFGKWNKAKNDYDWTHSKPVFVPIRISTRGLSEPAIAELKDGTLLLEMRGSNAGLDPVKYPSRKWISNSKDGGKNWSPVTDLRYDTGEQFYAPATFAKFIRSHKTGKLYWIGNISSEPAKGNLPRYPLYIAEVDEKIPALKKKTLTIIDDRSPEDTKAVQFSNFSLLENRETLDLELFLSRFGEKADNKFSANAYKYTLTFR